MSALAEFQRNFSAALFDPQTASVLRLGAGVAVYQNTVTKGLIDALHANYPTVERLVGAEWFASAARLYAYQHLPAEPSLALYGADLPNFLSELSSTHSLSYLPHVAQLDRWWLEAHFAVDAAALQAASLQAKTPEQLAHWQLTLHPATRFGWLPHSAVSIWQHQRPSPAMPAELLVEDMAEGVLITRPVGEIHATQITAAEFLFLQQIAAGELLGGTATQVLAQYPDADLAAMLARFLNTGAFS